MDVQQCQQANWQTQGIQDGQKGLPASQWFRYQSDCSLHPATSDQDSYERGRQTGLREYCTTSRGQQEGRAGHNYLDACPADTAPAFLAGYRRGRYVHDVEEDLDEVHRQIDATQSQLIAAPGTRVDTRYIYSELRELSTSESTLRRHLMRAEMALARGEPLPELYKPGYWRHGFPFDSLH